MISYEKALEMIAFQEQKIADLTAENERLKSESANCSGALASSNAQNAELCAENADMRDALTILGVTEDVLEE